MSQCIAVTDGPVAQEDMAAPEIGCYLEDGHFGPHLGNVDRNPLSPIQAMWNDLYKIVGRI